MFAEVRLADVCRGSSSSKFISNHTDIVIHMVIYSIILHI